MSFEEFGQKYREISKEYEKKKKSLDNFLIKGSLAGLVLITGGIIAEAVSSSEISKYYAQAILGLGGLTLLGTAIRHSFCSRKNYLFEKMEHQKVDIEYLQSHLEKCDIIHP